MSLRDTRGKPPNRRAATGEATAEAGGLPRLTLTARDGARVQISLYGAQALSWTPAGGRECLFLSRASQFRAGEPIRGGVPVAFPQFGAFGPLPLHGLARLMAWELAGPPAGVRAAARAAAPACAVLRLAETPESLRQWPHPFLAELTIAVGANRLEMSLMVSNPGATAFEFTAGLHTYLRADDLQAARLSGLEGRPYRDVVAGGAARTESDAPIVFCGEVNRIYDHAPAEARWVEPDGVTRIRKTGFPDTVIWNPGPEKCAAIPDLEAQDYLRFVCVEAVAVSAPLRLEPGQRWRGSQALERAEGLL